MKQKFGGKKQEMHKFDKKANITYLDLFRETFQGMVKLARLMETELGKEQGHKLVYKCRVEGDLELIQKQMKGKKPIESFADFKALMKGLHESPLTRNLFTITYPINNDDEIEFHTTECILAKVFKEMNAGDLGYIMCCLPDFETTPAYCPNVYLNRSKTLMNGDSYCDTKYSWKKK